MQKMILQSKRRKVKMYMNYFVLAVFLLEPMKLEHELQKSHLNSVLTWTRDCRRRACSICS